MHKLHNNNYNFVVREMHMRNTSVRENLGLFLQDDWDQAMGILKVTSLVILDNLPPSEAEPRMLLAAEDS